MPGDTSYDLIRRMPLELPLRGTETVIIAIGTNDAQIMKDSAHPRVSDEEFRINLNTCVDLAKRHARWVILLHPYGLSPSHTMQGIRPICPQRLQAINATTSEVAQEKGCWTIDLGGALKDDHFFDDGVHPNPKGHDLIAELVWEGLEKTGCLGN